MIRKIKLKDYDEKTKEIDILIDEVYSLLKSNRWESFLKIAENDDLWNATIFLQKMLTKVRQNSYDIAHKLTAFHNKIKLQAAIYKKLQKIKLLKDKYLLKENTNIEQLLESRGTLFFSPQQHYQYHLNIPFLQTDEGGDLILKTNKKYHKHTSSISETPAQEIASKATESKVKQVQVFSLQHLKQIFVAGNGSDLFAFLLDFDFQTEVSFEKKVTLFCQIVSRYSDELQDAKQYKTINNVEYAVFASKKIKK